MSGALSTANPACSTLPLCSGIDRADAVEHRSANAQAVVDLRRLRQVEHRFRQHGFAIVEIDPADQVGFVLTLREPARRGTRRAAIGQGENRRTARRRRRERIGVQRDEQVGLDAPGFLDPRIQGDVVVVVAGQHRAHSGLGIDEGLEPARDRQRDVLLEGAASPDRTGVLATMPGIDGDDDRTSRRCGFGCALYRLPSSACRRHPERRALPRAMPSADRAASMNTDRARHDGRSCLPVAARITAGSLRTSDRAPGAGRRA